MDPKHVIKSITTSCLPIGRAYGHEGIADRPQAIV